MRIIYVLFHLVSNLIILDSISQQVFAFNLDFRSAVIKPGKKGTYFGYSVALYRFIRERHLLIGAPLANGSMNVESAGALFKCNIERLSGCTQVHLDKRGEEVINGTKTEKKIGQWLGATLVSSKSGFVLTCAPRYIHFSENVRRREPVGLCYLSTLTLHTDSFEYSPCRLADQWGYHRRGSCQAGFSGAISKSGNSFFITAPGSYYWQGQVYSYSRNNTSYSPIFTQERSVVDDDTYFGYAITSGRFSEDPSSMDIAVSMPKGDLRGKVIILDRNLNLITTIKGDMLGSYFGYALTSLDANGDGFSDLVISAPMFSSEDVHRNQFDYDYGRVYIFYQIKKFGYFGKVDKINGFNPRSRFGTSLANLGDLNKDGFEDLAIGAPYEGSGTVYIFLGSVNGLSTNQPSQVLKPEYIPQGLGIRSFGWSLAGGVDLNNDDYPDLLVGAYESDAVVFFKSRAIIDTKVKFDFTPSNISLITKECSKIDGTQVSCLTFDVCFAYNGGRAVPNRLKFLWFVTLDVFNNRTKPRMYVVNRENDNLSVNKGILGLEKGNYGQCNKFKAYVSDYIVDKLSPIVIELQYHVQNYYNLPINSRMHTPMLNRLRPNKIYKSIHIMQNCGKDNVCIPDLKIAVTKNFESYTLNGQDNLILYVNVINNGEDAFSTVLNVDLPEDVHIVKIHRLEDFQITWQEFSIQQSGKNRLIFYLGNPLPGAHSLNFNIELSGKATTSSLNSDYTFIFNITSANAEKSSTLFDNVLVIGIPLRVNITLEPFGQSFVNGKAIPYIHNLTEFNEQVKQNHKIENVFFSEQESIVRHSYYLRNRGPSTLAMNVTILWPEKTIDGRFLFEIIEQPNVRLINQFDRMDMNVVKNKKNDNKPAIQVECERLKLGKISTQLTSIEHHQILEQESKLDQQQDTIELDEDGYFVQNQDQLNYFQNNYQTTNHRRVKRKYALQEPAQSIFTMDCDLNQCRRIQCTIREMIENTEVIFEILSRPWNQTLRHISISKFPVTSVLIAQITSTNLEFNSDLTLPIVINITTWVHLIGGHLDVIIPLKSLVIAVVIGSTLFGILTLVLIKLDFFKRESIEMVYERKFIDNSTASNSLVDQHSDELLDRHLNRKFTKTTNYLQKGRLLRKKNLDLDNDISNRLDRLDSNGSIYKRNRISTKRMISHSCEYHNELTSGGEIQSSTYEEYRRLEENIDEFDDKDDDEESSNQESDESEKTSSQISGSNSKSFKSTNSETTSNEMEDESENDDEEDDEDDENDDENDDEEDEVTSTNHQTDEESGSAFTSKDEMENESCTDEQSNQADHFDNLKDKELIYRHRKINKQKVIYKSLPSSKSHTNNFSNTNQPTTTNRSHSNKYTNEKLYDKLHYKKNHQYYNFFKDTRTHEPSCPLYSSRRSLVSYK